MPSHDSESWREVGVHGDEASWPMQLTGIVQGEHCCGWLWIFVSEDCVSVHIDRRQCAVVPYLLFAGRSGDESRPVLVCDRYRAYQNLAREMRYELAPCWAHARRDHPGTEMVRQLHRRNIRSHLRQHRLQTHAEGLQSLSCS